MRTGSFALELKAAEARPTKATSRAEMRKAAFIFGNLSRSEIEGDFVSN
jgi:hypothetical protein